MSKAAFAAPVLRWGTDPAVAAAFVGNAPFSCRQDEEARLRQILARAHEALEVRHERECNCYHHLPP